MSWPFCLATSVSNDGTFCNDKMLAYRTKTYAKRVEYILVKSRSSVKLVLVDLLGNSFAGTPEPKESQWQSFVEGQRQNFKTLKSLSGNSECQLHFFSQI